MGIFGWNVTWENPWVLPINIGMEWSVEPMDSTHESVLPNRSENGPLKTNRGSERKPKRKGETKPPNPASTKKQTSTQLLRT